MSKSVIKVFLLTGLIISQALAIPLPQDDDTENNGNEEAENEEEEYYEEDANSGSTIAPGIKSTGDEEVDNYLKRNYHVKQIVSEKLGITNFSRQSLYEHSTNALLSYITDRTKDKLPSEPPIELELTEPPVVIVKTRKYKIRQRPTTSPAPVIIDINPAELEGIKKTFEITLPNDISNSAGGTIEISIPTHLTSDSQLNIVNPNQLTLLSKTTQEGGGGAEDVNSFEAAIKQALLLAQQRTGINMSTLIRHEEEPATISSSTLPSVKSENENDWTLKSVELAESTTLKFEPEANSNFSEKTIYDLINTAKPEVENTATPEVIIVDLQTTPEAEYVEYIEEEIIERTRKPVRVRTTTARPTLTSNPLADMIKMRFQNNGISGFIFDSVINTTKSGAKIAAGAVWCALFDYCPDEKEEKEAEERAV